MTVLIDTAVPVEDLGGLAMHVPAQAAPHVCVFEWVRTGRVPGGDRWQDYACVCGETERRSV